MPNQSQKPWHDWRDDARELAIVVGGVLIALLAQQVVQNWEWNQKVAAAETSMKRELLWDDGPQIYQRAMMHPCLTQRLDQIRSAIEAHAPRDQIFALTDSYQVHQLTYDVVALQAAMTSDVSSHIRQDMLEHYMMPYAVMPDLGHTAAAEQEHIARLHALSRTGGRLSDAEGDAGAERGRAAAQRQPIHVQRCALEPSPDKGARPARYKASANNDRPRAQEFWRLHKAAAIRFSQGHPG